MPRIIMWEKNCLRHGEFDLPKGVTAVQALAWNTVSKILAVHVVENNTSHSVLFYVRNNYKWFLKNRLSLDSRNLPVQMQWSSKQKTHLVLLTQKGEVERLALRESFVMGPVKEEANKLVSFSLSLAIEGATLGVTPTSRYSVAPPLSHFTIKYPVEQGWSLSEAFATEGLIIALLRSDSGQERIYVSKYEFDLKLVDTYLLTDFEGAHRGPLRTRMLQALNVTEQNPTGKQTFKLSFVTGVEGHDFNLVTIKFESVQDSSPDSKPTFKTLETTSHSVKPVTFGFTFSSQPSQLPNQICYIQEDGSAVDEDLQPISADEINLSVPAEIISRLASVLPFGASEQTARGAFSLDTTERAPLQCLYLTDNGQLYSSNGMITDNCTSCVVSPTGFVLTTVMTQGMFDLLFVHKLSEVGSLRSAIQRAPKTSSGKDHRLRNIERGSEIVSVAGQRLTLDLPRGNLEVIYPKYLLFHYIKHLIVEEQKYFEAYKEIRRHKLDLNLLIDISPSLFSQVVHNGVFLKQFRKVDDINLILTSLEAPQAPDLQYISEVKSSAIGGSTTVAAQSAPASSEDEAGGARDKAGPSLPINNKINSICELLRAEMVKTEPDHFVLSIVMTYCRQVPPRLEEALSLVREIQQREEKLAAAEMLGDAQEDAAISGLSFSIPAPPHLNSATGKREKKAALGAGRPKHSSQEVLEYLSWVSDPEYLYSVALSTFDLQLAVMVAETTQRDPKEYLPYIETIKKIDNDVDRKVKICLDTKRWDRAVEMLATGNEGQVQKALALIKEKNLFAHGLDAFSQRGDFANLDKVKELLANYYQKHAGYKHAGPLFNSIGKPVEAIDCFNQALDWKSGLAVIEAHSSQNKTALDGVLQVVEGLPNREEFLEKLQEDYIARKLYPEAAKIFRKRDNFSLKDYLTLLIEKAGDCRTLKQVRLQPASNPEHKELVEKTVIPALELRAEIAISDLGRKVEEHAKLKARLAVVQEKKLSESEGGLAGLLLSSSNAQKFDNVSELSLESKGTAGISVVTGASTASKKMKQPKNLAKRKVQEGSPFEEEYLVEKINLFKIEENEVKDVGHLVDALVLYGRASKAREVVEALVRAEEAASKKKGFAKTLRQTAFEKEHPELSEIYNHIEEFQDPNHLKQLEEKELKKGKKTGSAQELKDKLGWLFENPN